MSAPLALTDDAQALLTYARERWDDATPLGALQWVLAALESARATVAAVAPSLGDLDETQRSIFELVHGGETGEPAPTPLLLKLAQEMVLARGGGEIAEEDLVRAILAEGGFPLESLYQPAEPLIDPFADTLGAQSPSLLDQLGVDLTHTARQGQLGPVVGREAEIAQVIETLCRHTKRNPALIGPAGVGKTAIVEGLAQRIADGTVPAPLRGVRLVLLSVTALVAGCKLVGELEARMQTLLQEAARPDIILFIDEAHTLVGAGAGGREGNDLANMLKPALARGEVACIAATTDEEYQRFIEADTALERRFQPITIPELSPEATLGVLARVRDYLAAAQGVQAQDDVLAWIIGFAGQFMHNRHFPDKAIDILEQCLAAGVTAGKTELTLADAEAVAERMVGRPQALETRLACLRGTLADRCTLPATLCDALVTRLQVTMRGVDLCAARPNAVVLLLGAAAAQSELLGEALAECLFGDATRLVSIDWARFTQPADLTMLLGSPPGYVGYQGRVPLHQVAQMPWCVLRCDNLHAAHPAALEVLAQGLREGRLTLADGKHVYLSDTIVLLTAALPPAAAARLGFDTGMAPAPASVRSRAAALLGDTLVQQVDLACDALTVDADARRHWLQECLLTDLSARFRPLGLQVYYDASLLTWMIAQSSQQFTQMDWERLVDEHLCPAIIPWLPAVRQPEPLPVTLTVQDDRCVAHPCPPEGAHDASLV